VAGGQRRQELRRGVRGHVLDLDALFDSLLVGAAERDARVQITDNGDSVDVRVDTDGNVDFDLLVATINTADEITTGADVLVGT
jgi:hypothetical protein